MKLHVYLNNYHIGFLNKKSSGDIRFNYSNDWINNGFAISSSLPIQEGEYTGEQVSFYFDNLLPDNEEIRTAVARKFKANSIKAFDLLQKIGRDCVGALSFSEEASDMKDFFELNYSKITDKEIAEKLRNLSSASPLGMGEGENDFRLSIAGAQEKMALLKINGNWLEPKGRTPTTHILKRSIGALNLNTNFDDSVDNEWASLYLASKLGLETCEAKIECFEEQRVLSVKRFDRQWHKEDDQKILLRIPQEDMCQALGFPNTKKYQNDGGPSPVDIGNFLRASNIKEDRETFIRSLIIFDLLYAPDGHAKNFSVFLEDDGFKLTPFYDIMSGYFLIEREKMRWQKVKLAMGVGNSNHYRFDKIHLKHYEETAKNIGISSTDFKKIIDDVKQRYESLDICPSELDENLNKETLDLIIDGMSKRASRLFD